MSKIYIRRNFNYMGMAVKYRVQVDGVENAEVLANRQTIAIDVAPGQHDLAIRQRMNTATKTTFSIGENEDIYFETGISKVLVALYIPVILGMIFTMVGSSSVNMLLTLIGAVIVLAAAIYMLIYTLVLKKSYYIKEMDRRPSQM